MSEYLDYAGLQHYNHIIATSIYNNAIYGVTNNLFYNLNSLKSLNTSPNTTWNDNVFSWSFGITYTVNSDNSITVNGASTTATSFILLDNVTANDFIFNNFIIGFSESSDIHYFVQKNSSPWTLYFEDTGNGTQIDTSLLPTTGLRIVISTYANANINNATIYPMLCNTEIFKIVKSYQPYAQSNVQLTEFVQNPVTNTEIDSLWTT